MNSVIDYIRARDGPLLALSFFVVSLLCISAVFCVIHRHEGVNMNTSIWPPFISFIPFYALHSNTSIIVQHSILSSGQLLTALSASDAADRCI